MTKDKGKYIIGCLAVLFFLETQPFVFANNLIISNVSISSVDTTADTATIQFDISQENSWRDATNYDAIWVFVKFKNGATWAHATMKTAGTDPSGSSTGTDGDGGTDRDNVEIIVPTDKVGCFIQRSENETGTLDRDSVKIVWDYGKDGVSDSAIYTVGLKVAGIEMVYVPQASFYAGDTSGMGVPFCRGSADTDPWYIESEAAITTQNAAADVFYYDSALSSGEDVDGAAFTIPAEFPKGYKAFYCMKYELSQAHYRDFLNTLTQAQQNTRVEADLSNENDATFYVMISEGMEDPDCRQTIKASENPLDGQPYVFGCDLGDNDVVNEPGDGEWIAMNDTSWMDMCAYADWSGLRPMTELEFEKACRGPLTPVSGEYAWGTTNITEATSFTNSGQSNEGVGQSGNGLCAYASGVALAGPCRVGFASTASTTTRQAAGATYYGIMEMSGNVVERAVTIGSPSGRPFKGTNGDGVLTVESGYEGNATNTDWPGIDGTQARGVTGGVGFGLRGGLYMMGDILQISDRSYGVFEAADRDTYYGIRLVRTAE